MPAGTAGVVFEAGARYPGVILDDLGTTWLVDVTIDRVAIPKTWVTARR
jgi:hypothetical protein